MPAAVAIPLIVGGLQTASTIYSAKKQSDANKRAADIASKSASDSAALQKQSSDDTLAFTRQQAQNDYRNQEITRRANYDQYAASQNRLKFLDSEVGLPERQVQDYVASQDPNFTGTPSAGQVLGTPRGPAPSVDGSAASISAYFKSRGVPDSETPYWVSKWPELVARGKEINDPNYALSRLAKADIFGGGAPSSKQVNTPYTTPYSAATYLQQRQNPLPDTLSGY